VSVNWSSWASLRVSYALTENTSVVNTPTFNSVDKVGREAFFKHKGGG
jgi:hypothetical protein